ncbi:putative beta-lysine N-acetyltransferase [Sutcliffiella halmapala]|uniref:putative beta-lysine N-acetyltransferase n=1 Tax=Sutcliffiella halmapala TaxID=79882 RepID=UPI00099530F2|nr:putative beta-lysine N-acetyltransferase [Sutcliffiella halmapala]
MKERGERFIIQNEYIYLKGYKDFYNERLKLEDFRGDIKKVFIELESLQQEEYVKKTIVQSRAEKLGYFIEAGFTLEAIVKGYYLGTDAYYFCKYKELSRFTSEKWGEEDQILEGVKQKSRSENGKSGSMLQIRKATIEDANNLSRFYASVFPIYPVPIESPEYVTQQIKDNTIFHLIEENGIIIAAASAEINREYKNAEITDCATLPSHRKGGYMNDIIRSLEEELIQNQVFCSYSIARALSFGMNAVLHNLNYSYSGRLKNNCYIYDKIEDMNVWSKDLSRVCAENSADTAIN